MQEKYDFVISRLSILESAVKELINKPSQKTVEKAVEVITSKLDDRDAQRDKILDLELKNLSKSLLLDVKTTFKEAHSEFEKKIESSVNNALKTQKDKVSWTIEIIRFVIVFVMFILSIKLV